MYICVYVYVHHIYTYVYIHTYWRIHMYTHISSCRMCMYVDIYIDICEDASLPMYMYICIDIDEIAAYSAHGSGGEQTGYSYLSALLPSLLVELYQA